MTRRRACRVIQGAAALLPRMPRLKAEPPVWGARRLWAYWRWVEQRPVHQKRGLRVRREWWGIEMTTVLGPGGGGGSLVVVLAWDPKVMVGDATGIQCTAQDGLAALEMAVNGQFPHGVRGEGRSRMSDHGCQPTSLAFRRACATVEIPQAFTRENTPKGKADTERVRRTQGAPGL